MQLLLQVAITTVGFFQRIPAVVACCGVAICFSGHFKAYSSSQLLRESIKTNLVDTLRDNTDYGCGVDVFAYSSQSEAANESMVVADFIQNFEVIRFAVAPPDEPLWGNNRALPPRPSKLELDRLGHWTFAENPAKIVESARSQYQKIMRCYDLVLDHETHRGRYAWVVRTRFDGAWYRPFSHISTFHRDHVWVKNSDAYGGVQDHFFLAPRHLSDAAFGAAAWLFDNEAPRWWAPGLHWQHETFLWKAWYECGVPFGRASIPMVLMRENAGPYCFTNRAWPTPVSLLGFLVNEEVAPGEAKLVEALRRTETAACFRGIKIDTIHYRVNFNFPRNGALHHADVALSANPTRNADAVLAFCDKIGLTDKLQCEAFAEGLWREDSIPLNLQAKKHCTEQEYQWIARELLALDHRINNLINNLNRSSISYAYDLVFEAHNAPNSRAPQPPSSQRICIAPKFVTRVPQAALCVYTFTYGLVLTLSAAESEWPNVTDYEACLVTLHEAEQAIEALLDAHKLVNPTWGGMFAVSQMHFRGENRISTQLSGDVAEAAVVLC